MARPWGHPPGNSGGGVRRRGREGFVHRHTALLKELEVVSRITRRVKGEGKSGLLSATERAELKRSCAAFGAAWRESYRRILTPKAHIVEVHVPLCRPLPRVRCLRRGRQRQLFLLWLPPMQRALRLSARACNDVFMQT